MAAESVPAPEGDESSQQPEAGSRRPAGEALAGKPAPWRGRGQDTKVNFMPLSRERMGNAVFAGSIHDDFVLARAS